MRWKYNMMGGFWCRAVEKTEVCTSPLPWKAIVVSCFKCRPIGLHVCTHVCTWENLCKKKTIIEGRVTIESIQALTSNWLVIPWATRNFLTFSAVNGVSEMMGRSWQPASLSAAWSASCKASSTQDPPNRAGSPIPYKNELHAAFVFWFNSCTLEE